jgi:hypothetical protein
LRALLARSLTAGEPGPLGLVLGQRDRLTVGLTCFVVSAEPAEQVGAGGVERVVGAQVQVVALLRAQRSEPAHRVRQLPGPGQSHPLRVARPAPRLRRGPAGQHYAGVRH